MSNVTNPSDPENGKVSEPKMTLTQGEYCLKTFHSAGNMLAHILVGIVVSIQVFFAYRNGPTTSSFSLHIVLCAIGYQLLMAESILALSAYNGWSAHLKLVDKRRAHWILQIGGSGLAIVGSFLMILERNVNFTSLHGQFGLVALVFTTVSLVNGLASLWAYELRKCIPGLLSKATHICFGTVAFVAAAVTVCYGFQRSSFMRWCGEGVAYTLVFLNVILTIIIIFHPLLTFAGKFKRN